MFTNHHHKTRHPNGFTRRGVAAVGTLVLLLSYALLALAPKNLSGQVAFPTVVAPAAKASAEVPATVEPGTTRDAEPVSVPIYY